MILEKLDESSDSLNFLQLTATGSDIRTEIVSAVSEKLNKLSSRISEMKRKVIICNKNSIRMQ